MKFIGFQWTIFLFYISGSFSKHFNMIFTRYNSFMMRRVHYVNFPSVSPICKQTYYSIQTILTMNVSCRVAWDLKDVQETSDFLVFSYNNNTFGRTLRETNNGLYLLFEVHILVGSTQYLNWYLTVGFLQMCCMPKQKIWLIKITNPSHLYVTNLE